MIHAYIRRLKRDFNTFTAAFEALIELMESEPELNADIIPDLEFVVIISNKTL